MGSSQSLQHHEPNYKKGRTVPDMEAEQSNDPQPSQQPPVLLTRIEESESLMEQQAIKDCLDESAVREAQGGRLMSQWLDTELHTR